MNIMKAHCFLKEDFISFSQNIVTQTITNVHRCTNLCGHRHGNSKKKNILKALMSRA